MSNNYILILVWLAIMLVFTMSDRVYRYEMICGKMEKRLQPFWAFFVFLPLIIWASNRGWIGDTSTYVTMYCEMPENLSGIPQYMENVTKDKGFYFVSALLRVILGYDYRLYLGIIAFFHVIAVTYLFRKYSPAYMVSVFLFIASTDYISWMFNGVRQFTAVAVTLFAFPFILEKKYWRAIFLIIIASRFHGSALLFIPFIFVCQGKAWNKKTLLFIVISLIVVLGVDSFTNILDEMLADTQYKNVVSDWQEWGDDGTNVLRVLVYAMPALISLIGYRYISRENNVLINICTNMSIVSVGFYVISMYTSGIFIGRLPIYFSLYGYLLLPWEIQTIFTKKSTIFVYFMMCMGYLGFYFYSISML